MTTDQHYICAGQRVILPTLNSKRDCCVGREIYVIAFSWFKNHFFQLGSSRTHNKLQTSFISPVVKAPEVSSLLSSKYPTHPTFVFYTLKKERNRFLARRILCSQAT